MNCGVCGQALPGDAKFCPNCGAFPNEKSATAAAPAKAAGTPAVPAAEKPPVKRMSFRTTALLVLSGLLIFTLLVVGGWLYFFPPWIYDRDSFSSVHPDLASRMQEIGGMTVHDGLLEIAPRSGFYTAILYGQPASSHSSVNATVAWTAGDPDSAFGIACCATDASNFMAYMIQGDGSYILDRYEGGRPTPLAGPVRLPAALRIQPGVPYRMKMIIEGQYLSLYLNETMLMKILDDSPHHGLPGLFTKGSKSGNTRISFDYFEARKNSIFQRD